MENRSQTSDGADTLLGRSLGKFRIIERLGSGGMGVVYRAEDTSLGRAVAVKTLASDRTSDPSRNRRLLREARSLATLSHSSIATVYEVGEADGVTFIAMELIGGRSLKERLQSGPLPAREAVPLFIAIADALAHAHANGVIHRDLKPSNAMLTGGNTIKLLDFGIAKLLEAEPTAGDGPTTHEGQVLGTPAYMSPEQARGDATDHRSDIFSFGSLMYAAVSGKPPFDEETPYETIVAVYRRTPVPLSERAPSVPSALSSLIHRCMRKEPERRYQREGAVRTDLELLPADATMTAVGTTPPGTPSSTVAAPSSTAAAPRATGRLLVPLLLVGALIAGAAGVYSWFRWYRTNAAGPSAVASREPAAFRERRLTSTSPEKPVFYAALSTDNSLLAYSTIEGVWISSPGSDNARQVEVPALRGALDVSFFPDNSRLLVAGFSEDGPGEIWVVPLHGGGSFRVYSGEPVLGIEVSPTGREFVFAAIDGIYVQSLEPPYAVETILRSTDLSLAAWSPDGQQLAYLVVELPYVNLDARGEIWVANRDGSATRRIVRRSGMSGELGPSSLAWTDDSTVAFMSFGDENVLWQVSANGDTDPQRIRDWSDDQVVILGGRAGSVLISRRSFVQSVTLAEFDDEQNRLTRSRTLATRAKQSSVVAWTRDGRIVLVEGTPFRSRIVAIEPQTAALALIADDIMPYNPPAVAEGGVFFWRHPEPAVLTLFFWDAATDVERLVLEVPIVRRPRVGCALGRSHSCLMSELDNGRMTFRELSSSEGVSTDAVWSHEFPGDVTWSLSPDGDRIAYPLDHGRAGVLDLATGERVEFSVFENANLQLVSWTPKDELIFCAAWLPGVAVGAIVLTDSKGKSDLLWTSDAGVAAGAHVSPDGKWLAFSPLTHQGDLWLLEPVE